MSNRDKVVFVIGSTGTGKSKLAVDISLGLSGVDRCGKPYPQNEANDLEINDKFGGEVVSTDSMQIFIGNDISSATVTEEEMQGVPHHMVSFVKPNETIEIEHFRRLCAEKINEIQERGHIPVIAGGTMLWVESLLFKSALTDKTTKARSKKPASTSRNNDDAPGGKIIPANLDKLSKKDLFGLLTSVDPLMANRLHHNDQRKVKRALEVARDSGKLLSQTLLDQQQEAYSEAAYDTCIIWLYAKPHVLKTRLDTRVDSMVKQGLKEEVLALYRTLASSRKDTREIISDTKGVAQSIGFKELGEYMAKAYESETERKQIDSEHQKELDELWKKGVERLKTATRKYAQRQVKWIRTRLKPYGTKDGGLFEFHQFDTSDVKTWNNKVRDPALRIVRAFLEKESKPNRSFGLSHGVVSSISTWRKFECKDCNKTLNGNHEYNIHMKSRSHRKRKAGIRRMEENKRNAESVRRDRSTNKRTQSRIYN
ncbi:hypothetical protein AAMO2058_000136800 [Amorphochlora amoebiformis]